MKPPYIYRERACKEKTATGKRDHVLQFAIDNGLFQVNEEGKPPCIDQAIDILLAFGRKDEAARYGAKKFLTEKASEG